MLRLTGAAALLLMAAGVARGAGQAPGRADTRPPRALTTASGVYTAAQASKGEQVYMTFCVSCHPAGTYAAPSFREKWNGAPLAKLFDLVTETMPKNEPGSLETRDYVHVISYILQINGAPAGKTPLPDDSAALSKIRVYLPRR